MEVQHEGGSDEEAGLEVVVRSGDELKFVSYTLGKIKQQGEMLGLRFDVGAGNFDVLEALEPDLQNDCLYAVHGRPATRVAEDLEQLARRRDAAAAEHRTRRLSVLVARSGAELGELLHCFTIGDVADGYPARDVSSAQWCGFFRQCPALETVYMTSCYTADDDVMDVLAHLQWLRELTVCGNDRVSGAVTNAALRRLCDAGDEEVEEGLYFGNLMELVLMDQSGISYHDFEMMLARHLAIRFVFGRSGGHSLGAVLAGADIERVFDTAKMREREQNVDEGWDGEDGEDGEEKMANVLDREQEY